MRIERSAVEAVRLLAVREVVERGLEDALEGLRVLVLTVLLLPVALPVGVPRLRDEAGSGRWRWQLSGPR